MSEIMSIEEIGALLKQQAAMRAPENDEAGVLRGLADKLRRDVAALEAVNLIRWTGTRWQYLNERSSQWVDFGTEYLMPDIARRHAAKHIFGCKVERVYIEDGAQ